MKDILQKVDHNDGITVPEGYFDDFASRMTASLPKRPWEEDLHEGDKPTVLPRSIWQRVRPYVYMAAMFIGVWCMMNMFDLIRSSAGLGVEQSATLAAAIDNDQFVSDYLASNGALDDYTFMDDLYEQGFVPGE